MEFEFRQSDYIVIASKKSHLESCTVDIRFDRASIVDLLMARELTQEADFVV